MVIQRDTFAENIGSVRKSVFHVRFIATLQLRRRKRGGLSHVISEVVTRWEHIIKVALILHKKPTEPLVLLRSKTKKMQMKQCIRHTH